MPACSTLRMTLVHGRQRIESTKEFSVSYNMGLEIWFHLLDVKNIKQQFYINIHSSIMMLYTRPI